MKSEVEYLNDINQILLSYTLLNEFNKLHPGLEKILHTA